MNSASPVEKPLATPPRLACVAERDQQNGPLSCFHHLSHQASWIAGDDCIRGYIMRDYAACTDYRVLTDRHTAQNGRARTDRGATFDNCFDNPPVSLGLRCAFSICGSRVLIINEGDVVADKHIVFNRHTFTDKCVARDFYVPA